MYVLRDVNMEFQGLKTQIDFIIITAAYMEDCNKILNIDYFSEYEDKFFGEAEQEPEDDSIIDEGLTFDDIRKRLITYRSEKAKEKNLPINYIFNNLELDEILEVMPETKEELVNAKILTDMKIKLCRDEIVEIINSKRE